LKMQPPEKRQKNDASHIQSSDSTQDQSPEHEIKPK
jgi:hypothetical protein